MPQGSPGPAAGTAATSRQLSRATTMTIEATLKKLAEVLYGTNYQVFLRLYRLPFSPRASAEEYITQALGPAAVVGRTSPATGPEVLAEVEAALRYAGDRSSGPRPSALRSKKEGHPACPVFWDFSYVLAGPTGANVFIGSSSD